MILQEITDEEEILIAERGQVEYLRSESRYPSAFGFFLQPYGDPFDKDSKRPASKFLDVCEEGKNLKESKWCNFDETLSYLGQEVDIVASSNGFLLCRANPKRNRDYFTLKEQNMDYIICNPVTREFQILPRCHKAYIFAPLVFICRGDGLTPLHELQFEIVRAGVSTSRQFGTILPVETFSSVTNKWAETSVVSDSPFRIDPAPPAFVVGGVIFWIAFCHALLAFDPSMGSSSSCAKLIEPPLGRDGQVFVCDSAYHGPSEGKVHYARSNYDVIEIWVLENCKSAVWVLRHQVTLTHFRDYIPERVRALIGITIENERMSSGPDIRGFHPRKSQLLFVMLCCRPFWYDLESRKKWEIVEAFMPPFSRYFLYEWPLHHITMQ